MPNEDPTAAMLDPSKTGAGGVSGARQRGDPNEPVAVVGLGASAGGIAPLQEFFSGMTTDSGLAFVVVMHLSPEFDSQLTNILQQKTKMPVTQVAQPTRVKPNHVYVIPPNHQMTVEDSTLCLLPPQGSPGRRMTIDLFFRTLARAYGHRAVCVIMSGADSDGAIGLKHIRAQGGVTIAQDPNEAEYESMPAAAIESGMVDWVLSVQKMAPKLLEFVQNENWMKLPPEIPDTQELDQKDQLTPAGETISKETRSPEDESAIAEILANVHAKTRHDFEHYKRATVLRRIARRMQVHSLESIPQYLEFIHTHPHETGALLQDLLISVTHFFRDRDAFAALTAHIPGLFAGKGKGDVIRVWVPGCATGEEAYSIAILLAEYAERHKDPPKLQVFATDIDERAIAEARQGLYPSIIEADVSPERLRAYFVRDHGRYRVRKRIREKVLFASHDVLKDSPFSRCDLISCRNLLIYLTAQAQAQVFDVFHFALRPGGLLFVGNSENNSTAQSLFSAVDAKQRLFVRRSTLRTNWRAGLFPPHMTGKTMRSLPAWQARTLEALTQSGVGDATTKGAEAAHSGHARREVLFGALHLRLLEQYGPPSAVVNESHEIVHLSESAGRYLHFAAGEPTANIVKVIDPALQIELRAALFRAAQSHAAVRAAPQRVEVNGTAETISLEVRPMRASDQAHGFFLVLFEKQNDAPTVSAAAPAHETMARDADAEIQFLREQLSATVEQYEAANEELKASNEELQAMNEEMHSAAEELETNKEELQSINEEMVTINHELKTSVEELNLTNADLSNLMASTDIGTIFLDRDLLIQRFTPSAQKIFNLVESDRGRSISDITSRLNYKDFVGEAENVLRDLRIIEREVQMAEGTWHMTRIAPYRTTDDRIAGVVATFVDITHRKEAEENLRRSEARLRSAIEIETIGVIFFSRDGRITETNEAFLKMSGYTRDEVEEGRVRWDKMTPPEWMSLTLEEMNRFGATGKIGPYEKQYIRKDGTRWWGLFTGTELGENLGVEYVFDVSDRKEAEERLRASEERFRQFAENSADVFWILNAKTQQLEYINPIYEKMFGQSRELALRDRKRRLDLVVPQDREEAAAGVPRALAGETFTRNYRIIRPSDGETRWIRDTGFPIRSEAGEVVRIAGVAQDVTDEKERSELLRESEEKLRLLIEGAPEYAMFLMDTSNHIIYWSKGAELVFGWTAPEALGQTGELIFTPEDRANEVEEKEIATARRNGSAPDRRWHMRKDGSRIWVDGIMHRLDDEKGELRGYAKIARDATEQRRAEEELQQAHDELEQRVQERTSELTEANAILQGEIEMRARLEQEILLISEREKRRIGHDLHDSLCQELAATAFILETQAQKVAKKNSAQAKIFSEAARTVNANVGLARDLARGLHPIELSTAGLPNALRELAYRTEHSGQVSCRLVCPRPVRIRDDAVALNFYRIAQEAVTNALKHAGAGEIILSLKRKRSILYLEISDNGRGFAEKRSDKGMGVNIMHYRADVIGAKLTIDSRKGIGTTVTCVLPGK